jgi:hypothetical protein
MKLITDEQHTQLLANGWLARLASRAGSDFDPQPVVKLFSPGACSRWLLTEIDPTDKDRAYGICDVGDGRPEFGYVSLRELEDLRGKRRDPVVRDLRFVADKPLSAYAEVAYTRGLIIT